MMIFEPDSKLEEIIIKFVEIHAMLSKTHSLPMRIKFNEIKIDKHIFHPHERSISPMLLSDLTPFSSLIIEIEAKLNQKINLVMHIQADVDEDLNLSNIYHLVGDSDIYPDDIFDSQLKAEWKKNMNEIAVGIIKLVLLAFALLANHIHSNKTSSGREYRRKREEKKVKK